ncbi:hypothetical protein VNI00_010983 [Paramarasmius palmivorus]|uniref:Uncharacterized protein n=1 Tax=Paramarasmius palmivorus TaxID=297713 RepID=A0AAW0CGT4_9AGAR
MVVKPVQSTRTDPKQQQSRDDTLKSTINPSGKSQGPEKRVNGQHDARPVSTGVEASERNLKTTGHHLISSPTSATKSPQPIQSSTSGKRPAPAVSVKRTTKQVRGAIEPSKRTKDHDQADGKAGQPNSRSRQEAKKPVWR